MNVGITHVRSIDTNSKLNSEIYSLTIGEDEISDLNLEDLKRISAMIETVTYGVGNLNKVFIQHDK